MLSVALNATTRKHLEISVGEAKFPEYFRFAARLRLLSPAPTPLCEPPSSSMCEDDVSSAYQIYNFPHLLDCWLTEGEDLLPEEERRRLQLARAFLHPFESAEAFISEMKPLEDHWEMLMERSQACDPCTLLLRTRSYFESRLGTSNSFEEKQRRARPTVCCLWRILLTFVIQTNLTNLDEIALVYRFARGEHAMHLAALFQLSLSYTYLLLHNGVWLFSILWGALYYRHWDKEELALICAPPSYQASYVPHTGLASVVVAGDCTESEIASYDDLRFSKVVHSEKKKAPTLKIFTTTALNKFTLLHSAIYGGSATERAPAEAVIDSPEWMKLFEPVEDVLVSLDRGFAYGHKARLAPVALKKGHKWLPAFLNKKTQGFTVKQVASNQVRVLCCVSPACLLMPCPGSERSSRCC
jgi:hypothetical protein